MSDKRRKQLKTKKCIDCGCLISHQSKHCIPCFRKSGKLSNWLGKKHLKSTKQKMHLNQTGSKNSNWKPYEQLSYAGKHNRIRKILKKPKLCQECHKRKAVDLANKSNKYLYDKSDWEYLCRRCHMTKDHRMKNLKYQS